MNTGGGVRATGRRRPRLRRGITRQVCSQSPTRDVTEGVDLGYTNQIEQILGVHASRREQRLSEREAEFGHLFSSGQPASAKTRHEEYPLEWRPELARPRRTSPSDTRSGPKMESRSTTPVVAPAMSYLVDAHQPRMFGRSPPNKQFATTQARRSPRRSRRSARTTLPQAM